MEININILDTFPSIEKIEKDNDLYISLNKTEYSIKKLIKIQEKIRFYYTDNQVTINLYVFSSTNNTKIHLGSNSLNLSKIIEIINIDKKPYIVWLSFAKELKWQKESIINSNIFFYDSIRLKMKFSIKKINIVKIHNSKVIQKMKNKAEEKNIFNTKNCVNRKINIDKNRFRINNIKDLHEAVSFSKSNNNSKNKKDKKILRKSNIFPISNVDKYFQDRYSYLRINKKTDKNEQIKDDEFLTSNKNILGNSFSITQGNNTNITMNDLINSFSAVASNTCRIDNYSYIKKLNSPNSGRIKSKDFNKKFKETFDNRNNTTNNIHNNIYKKSKPKYGRHSKRQFNSLKYMPFKESYNQDNQDNQIINNFDFTDEKIYYSIFDKSEKEHNNSKEKDKIINIDDLIITDNKNNEDDKINNNKEINFEKFHSLKKDYELLYSAKFIKNIKEDLLFLDLNMALEKSLKLILEYNREIKMLYNENLIFNKNISDFIVRLKNLNKKFYLLQKIKQNNEYEKQKTIINKEMNFINDQNIVTNKITNSNIINYLYEKNSHKIKLKNIFDAIMIKKSIKLNELMINKNNSPKNIKENILNNKDESSAELKLSKLIPQKKVSKDIIKNDRSLLGKKENTNTGNFQTVYSRNSFHLNQNNGPNPKIKVNTYFPNNSNNISKPNRKYFSSAYSSNSQNNKQRYFNVNE